MQLTCPECEIQCTFDEHSADTFSCPGCGLLLYSQSGGSEALLAKPGAAVELSVEELEHTRRWQASLDEILPTPEQLPRRLGRYELTELLGEGSFAQVYRAIDRELGRDVALKIPRKHRFASPEHISRFVDEARTAAKLEHPGIVRVYDIGWLSDDVCFIAMEHCPGGSLDQLLKAGPVSQSRTAEIIADAAEAMHFAHLNGLVHRDLKPSNIMFGRDGRPRIVDFGLALPEEQQSDKAGEVAGTLPYMSPEQVRGEAHHLDGRSDIWSLGVILYQMLTGRRPFAGNRQQLAAEILNREPKPPRQVVENVPKELEEICLKCLSKSVTSRWATARDIAKALNAWLDTRRSSLTSMAPVPTAVPQTAPRRWMTQALLLGVLVLAIVPLGVYAAMVWSPRSGNRGSAQGLNEIGLGKSTPPREVESRHPALPAEPVAGRIYNLFDVRPQELFWPRNPVDGRWDYDINRKDLHVDSGTLGLLQAASTSAMSFRLELGIQKRNFSGRTGVFFGLPTTETLKPKPGTRFQTVFLVCPRGGKPRLQRSVVEQLPSPNGDARLSDRTCDYAFVPEPLRLESALEVVVNSGKVATIRWNGMEIPELSDRQLQPRDPFPDCRGAFGILNLSGSATLPYFRFTLLQKEQHE